MKKFYLFNWIFLLIGLVSFTAFGQTTIFNAAGNSSIEGWTYTNNVTENQIQQSSYWLIDAGNPSDIIISKNYIGSYTDIQLSFQYATYKDGANPVLKVEYSTDNGSNFITLGTYSSATSSTYQSSGNITVPDFSTSIMFRFTNQNTSGRGVRLKNIVLKGNEPINQPPVVSPKTITGTYGVLLTDGQITATNNPTSWVQIGGTLPQGITFDNGVFSGTPTQVGTFIAKVIANNDVNGDSDPADITFEIGKANQTVNYTFENLTQDQGTTFSSLPAQTDQGQNIVYTSADNSIVSTNGNILSFEGIGSTTISVTATSNDNYNEFSTTFNVSSKDPNIVTYNGEGTFVKINNLEEVTNGYYVFSYENKAMNNTLNSGKFGVQNITTENNRIINPSLSIVWKIDNVNNGLAIFNEEIGSYINYTTSTNFSLIKEPSTDNSKWSASFSNEGFLLRNVNSTDRGIIYRTTDVFGAYAITNLGGNEYKTLQLYKLLPSNSTTWDGTAWSNGTPDLTKEVILHATPTESFSAKKLTVERDMIIPAGITITVENEVVNQNDVTFRFRHGAYLIQNNNTAINVGPAIFERKSTPIYRYETLMWSSPVIGQNIREISPNTLENRFTRYNEATNLWDANVTASDNFEAGEMIAFRSPNDFNISGDSQTFESEFYGTPINGTITVPVTKNSKGYNAIGNPYASPINLSKFMAANTDVNSAFVWTHQHQFVDGAYTGSNWALFNGTGWNDPTQTSTNLDIAQGFIIEALNPGNITFDNAMRETSDGIFYKQQKDRLWLSLSNDKTKFNSLLVGYVEGSSKEYNPTFDAKPFEKAEGIYTLLNDELYSIQGRGEFKNDDAVNLSYNVAKAGTYQINLDRFEGVFDNQNIYLIDNKLDKVVNLTELKAYSFDSEAGEIDDRFIVAFQNKTLSTIDLNNQKGLFVTAQNKQINVVSNQSIKSIRLIDMTGRQLQNIQQVNAKTRTIQLNVNPQVIVVVVEDVNGKVQTKKVILK